jgi:hypothetical protein
MKKAVIAALAVLLLLAVSACGGSAPKAATLGPEEKKVATNIAKSFAADSSGALTAAESQCFANAFVGAAGLAKLKSAKLIDASDQLTQASAKFDTKLATQFANAFLGCVDYQKKQAQVIAAADKKVNAAKLEACLSQSMPESYVSKLIVATYTQTSNSAALITESNQKLETCRTQATSK